MHLRTRFMRRHNLLIAAATVIAVACGTDVPYVRSSVIVTHRVSGDTIVVRSSGGEEPASLHELVQEVSIGEVNGPAEYSFHVIRHVTPGESGSVWVFDSHLRHFDSAGVYLGRAGNVGQGPGEYEAATGLVVTRDGNAVVWDGARGNTITYGSSRELVGQRRVPDAHGIGMLDMQNRMYIDTAGNYYLRGRIGSGKYGLIRITHDWSRVDTLTPPVFGLQRWIASARSADGGTSMQIEFAPEEIWTWSPHAHFVAGRSDLYELHMTTPGGSTRRAERDINPVPFASREWEDHFEFVAQAMRQRDPKWAWSGVVPSAKPYFQGIVVGDDGDIWVKMHAPREEVLRPPDDTAAAGGLSYKVPVLYDVFAAEGEFRGRVAMPQNAFLMATRGDRIWAVVLDPNGVETVVRYRIEPALR